MQDAEGRLVPESVVKPQHKQEDRLVRELMQGAVNLNGLLAEFRQHAHQDIQAHLQLIAEQYGVSRGGKKGNVTLHSYDGTLRVQIAVGEFLDFGPELHSSNDLIHPCLTALTASPREGLTQILHP